MTSEQTPEQTPWDAKLRHAKQAYGASGPSDAQLARMLGAIEPPPSPSVHAPLGATLLKPALLVLAAVSAAAVLSTWLEPVPSPPSPPPAAEPGPAALAPPAPEPTPSAQTIQEDPPHDASPAATAERSQQPAKRARRERAPDPVNELLLLQRARRVVRSDPARALALAVEHARAYPRGVFVEERELLAVQALLAAQRRPEAERRARRFARVHAGSVHAHRMQVLLEAGED